MIKADEDALICDMAEVYHIYDYKQLPVRYIAMLACGLSNDSRIKRKLRGQAYTDVELLLAMIADSTRYCAWSKTKAAADGGKPPKSIYETMANGKKTESVGYTSAEDFENARAKLIGGEN